MAKSKSDMMRKTFDEIYLTTEQRLFGKAEIAMWCESKVDDSDVRYVLGEKHDTVTRQRDEALKAAWDIGVERAEFKKISDEAVRLLKKLVPKLIYEYKEEYQEYSGATIKICPFCKFSETCGIHMRKEFHHAKDCEYLLAKQFLNKLKEASDAR